MYRSNAKSKKIFFASIADCRRREEYIQLWCQLHEIINGQYHLNLLSSSIHICRFSFGFLNNLLIARLFYSKIKIKCDDQAKVA